MLPVTTIDATRSSHSWSEMPGNFDKLNCRALYPSTNQWGIPDLPAATFIPDKLVAYNDKRGSYDDSGTAAVHFFLDDYRFETMWTQPQRSLSRVKRVNAAMTPDFSLWREMPPVMQMWQVYRARWCGAWMLHHGIANVIPTIGWSGRSSYHFAFAGIAEGSVVAISSVGIRDDQAKKLYLHGVGTVIDELSPSTVLVYGRSLGEDVAYDGQDFRYFPTRWDQK